MLVLVFGWYFCSLMVYYWTVKENGGNGSLALLGTVGRSWVMFPVVPYPHSSALMKPSNSNHSTRLDDSWLNDSPRPGPLQKLSFSFLLLDKGDFPAEHRFKKQLRHETWPILAMKVGALQAHDVIRAGLCARLVGG